MQSLSLSLRVIYIHVSDEYYWYNAVDTEYMYVLGNVEEMLKCFIIYMYTKLS